MKIGYARSMQFEPDVQDQVSRLRAAGCARVGIEVETPRRRSRPELERLIGGLESGDVLVVTRLACLARSVHELLGIVRSLDARGAGLMALGETWADTTTSEGEWSWRALRGIAEFERALFNDRARAGRAAAPGKTGGRPSALDPRQIGRIRRLHSEGMSARKIATKFGVHASTIYRALARPAKGD